MFFQSCLPPDLPTRDLDENYPPIIEISSLTLDPFHGMYNFETDILNNKDKISVTVLDYNDDPLTVAWYVKHINNPNVDAEVDTKFVDPITHKAIFEYKIDRDELTCGLNQITFIVSDRGITDRGRVGDNGKPYPSPTAGDRESVKVDVQTWLIEVECNR